MNNYTLKRANLEQKTFFGKTANVQCIIIVSKSAL